VKQEAKKAQNAQMEAQRLQQVQQEQQLGQVPQQAMTDFYSLNNGYQAMAMPSSESLDANQSMDDPQQMFAAQQQQPDYNALFLTSIAESTQPATKDTVIQSMIKAGYNWDPQIGLQEVNGFDNSQFGLSLDMANVGASVGDAMAQPAMPQAFEYQEENGVSGVSPSNSTSSGPSATFSVAPTAASTATNPMASSSNLSFTWPDHAGSSNVTPAKQADNPFEGADFSSLPASSSQVSLPQWMTGPSFQPVMYHSSNNSSQVVLSSPEQVEAAQLQNFADLEPPMPPFAENAYSRRSSSTSVLADKLTNVGIQQVPSNDSTPSNSQSNGGFQPPASSLAARRQRHPAPLNQTMRSASFTSGMGSMPSPGAPQSLAAEHTLRRIRSTGITNGRIQKPTSASAQRSPLHFTFEQTANSPKFARQVAGYATAVSTPGLPVSSGSLAPPTPCTPSDGGRFPSAWQPNGIAKPRAPLTDTSSPPDSLGIQWPAEASGEVFPVNSPPRTPLEASQLHQLRQNNPLYRDTPPQSAPATQASFPRPMFAPASIPGQDFLAPSEINGPMGRPGNHHIRRPSLPVSTFPMDPSMPFAVQIPTAAGDLQVPYGMHAANPVMSGFPGDALPMYAHDSSHIPASGAGQSMPGGADFYVHQYAPPQGADAKGATSPRRQENQVKNYVFANAGPHDFQSTGAS
jgi:hypothetical protein